MLFYCWWLESGRARLGPAKDRAVLLLAVEGLVALVWFLWPCPLWAPSSTRGILEHTSTRVFPSAPQGPDCSLHPGALGPSLREGSRSGSSAFFGPDFLVSLGKSNAFFLLVSSPLHQPQRRPLLALWVSWWRPVCVLSSWSGGLHVLKHQFAGKSHTVTSWRFHFLRTRFAKDQTRIWSVKSKLGIVGLGHWTVQCL